MRTPPRRSSLDLRTMAVAISGAALGLLAAWVLIQALTRPAERRIETKDAPPPIAGLPAGSPPPVSAARATARTSRSSEAPATARASRSSGAPATARASRSSGAPATAARDRLPTVRAPATRPSSARGTPGSRDEAEPGPASAPPCDAEPRALGSARLRPTHVAGRMSGLQVLGVTDDTFWHEIGLASGDIILELEGAKIDDPQASIDLLRAIERSKRLQLTVQNASGDVRTVYWEAPERSTGHPRCP